MHRALLTCASLSLAAHALAVTLLPPLESPVREHRKPAKPPMAWQLRMLAHAPAAAIASTTDAGSALELDERESPASPLSAPVDSAPLEAAIPTQMGAQPDAAPPAAQTAASSPLVGDAGGDSPYIPRPELSIPPVPQAPVLLTAPPGQSEVSRISGILSLYIDEHGTVHHITASGEPMPPEFEQAARQAFMALTFRPGVLNGEPVKSRIRVEVVFDNTPLPPAEQPSGASAPR